MLSACELTLVKAAGFAAVLVWLAGASALSLLVDVVAVTPPAGAGDWFTLAEGDATGSSEEAEMEVGGGEGLCGSAPPPAVAPCPLLREFACPDGDPRRRPTAGAPADPALDDSCGTVDGACSDGAACADAGCGAVGSRDTGLRLAPPGPPPDAEDEPIPGAFWLAFPDAFDEDAAGLPAAPGAAAADPEPVETPD